MGALAHERDGHRVGVDAVARDAAGRVGGVEAGEYGHGSAGGRMARMISIHEYDLRPASSAEQFRAGGQGGGVRPVRIVKSRGPSFREGRERREE